jgi:glucosamine--fructose-6-phosphate aminotransferase (isomerizing)
MLALTLGHKKGFLSDEDFSHYTEELSKIPSMIEQVLRQINHIAEIAKTFTYAHNFMYLGRGWISLLLWKVL